ncbi:F0F1 ATP synthase subunit A [Patescibacteria group bacterium]|nr:F0F1 ATP synthase subunit A [Patescibacteria group bacterium]MBU1705161.1 F0F1 ATP synthase subunit A [Patescibacteria group bacterium]
MMVPPAAEALFHVGEFPITNSMVNGWVGVVFFVALALLISRNVQKVPKGLQNVAEGLVEFMLAEIKKVTGDNKRANAFLPIVGTIFLFILFSNWLGLIPGTGSIGIWGVHNGEELLIPILRPASSDLNLTLAIALFAVIASHVFGLRYLGFENHMSKFFNVRGIIQSIKRGPMAIIVAIIEFGVGLIEIISEIAKVLSLSLRLFGNIFAGEVLMTVMLGLFAFFLPLPFIFLEILVGAIQATVFAMLTLAYLTVATSAHEPEEEHESASAEAHA